MPNPYFHFKQFSILQDKCAMKVCTDACLFGAWLAAEISNTPLQRILDIGTGTGLLSLMLAQKNNARIDAVEKDTPAARQAAQNFEASAWKNRLHIFNEDIRAYQCNSPYQLVISNPPFFEADLKSSNQSKNDAKHDTALTLDALLSTANKVLAGDGVLAVLLPWQRSSFCIASASGTGLQLSHHLQVRQTVQHGFFRSILLFSKLMPVQVQIKEMSIKDGIGNYTPEFTSLLKDYYLYL
ncbi:MAG TPA: methyltransferase [Ferruginibacter sp.]|nr:methyltransferase [Ferruginibacter sp.]HMP21651.1 methyltransferase [Ferruginibacter sp.]